MAIRASVSEQRSTVVSVNREASRRWPPGRLWLTARPYVYLAPALIAMGIFVFRPLVFTVYNSFFQWNMISDRTPVGFSNFERVLRDPGFLTLVWQSALYMILAMISAFLLPVGLALLTMQVSAKSGAFYQSVLFVPAVISTTVGAVVWQFLYLQRGGPINAFLDLIGITPQAWLNDPNLALPSIGMITAWKFLGFSYIIALAGVAGLPREQLEAARIDGAEGWSMLKDITIPLLAPTMLFLGLTSVLQALPNAFVPIRVLTVGGPSGSTSNLLYEVYDDAFRYFQIGRSSARSVVLVLLLGGAAVWQFRLMERRTHYN